MVLLFFQGLVYNLITSPCCITNFQNQDSYKIISYHFNGTTITFTGILQLNKLFLHCYVQNLRLPQIYLISYWDSSKCWSFPVLIFCFNEKTVKRTEILKLKQILYI